MIFYIGDLSKADAEILKSLAESATSILEFGVGASTQILAAYMPPMAAMVSLETSEDWIHRTCGNMDRLGVNRQVVQFRIYGQQKLRPGQSFDLIFDDGADEFRWPFAEEVWPLLTIGGAMAFHDTRRTNDVKNVCRLIERYSPEIESVEFNKDWSNITVVRKQQARFYENWNEVEGREPWECGYAPVDDVKLAAKLLERSQA